MYVEVDLRMPLHYLDVEKTDDKIRIYVKDKESHYALIEIVTTLDIASDLAIQLTDKLDIKLQHWF